MLPYKTDHKPLETIFKKHLFSAPPPMAIMIKHIQNYDVYITSQKYVPGKDILTRSQD